MGFTFRQFHIEQERTAMKVGTDGVLLGAWAEGGEHILDIGTGTGLIALMMAERYPASSIVAIDIDKGAFLDAEDNFNASKWSNRIKAILSSIQDFSTKESNYHSFDAIVCNPPYFINSLKAPTKNRTTARHTDTLSYAELMRCVSKLLKKNGLFSVIIPVENKPILQAEGFFHRLKIKKIVYIKTTPNTKKAKRCMICFTNELITNKVEETVLLSNLDNNRSEWYHELTKEFYLR